MKYFLTGGSGTLGTELQKHLECFIPYRGNFDITWPAQENIDELSSIDNRIVRETEAFIHCAAYTDVPGSEVNRLIAVETNIIGTKNIVELAKSYGKRVVYISTDYVYSGDTGNFNESDSPNPFNFYGFTKLAGEAYLDCEKDLIIRTSFKKNDLWNTVLDKAFVDIYTSADYVDIIAKEISIAIKNNFVGIFNIGTERKTVYDLARQRNPNVGMVSRNEICCRMPEDISMNLEKFKKHKQVLEKSNGRK